MGDDAVKKERTHSFVRGVFGVYDTNGELMKACGGLRCYTRRTKIDNDIDLAKLNPYLPKVKVYVFGEDNFKIMVDKGWDCVLIDKRPIVWDFVKEMYRHKIEIWRAGLQEFDDVIFFDWDCVPLAPIPSDIWDVFDKGEKVRATIYEYRRGRAAFRGRESGKLSASTFVYIRGLQTCEEIIKTWEDIGRPWQEEVALSKYIDLMNGGTWKGSLDYMSKFETPYHTLYPYYPSSYVRDVMIPNNIFFHLNWKKVAFLLGDRNPENVKKRIDEWYGREKFNIQKILQQAEQKEAAIKLGVKK